MFTVANRIFNYMMKEASNLLTYLPTPSNEDLTRPTKRGDGLSGRELNSGWN